MTWFHSVSELADFCEAFAGAIQERPMGIVQRLQLLLSVTTDEEARATLEEAIDLLCQAGWGNPIIVKR